MREAGILLIGLFGIVIAVCGWTGAWIPLGDYYVRADLVGYLFLGAAVVLSLLGRKRGEA